ncbi:MULTISPECIES: tautomerase family protein [unclassified Variovorax]|uniref:tautomerase family protein n=1 Tax=unclassified Variovorax TaxID=663243 RepID=UPI0008B8CDC5|nr:MULTISPECIES: tautomerase family protein [unclassified Variovorax]SEK17346.1 Tautomerase enzyme [Variovorax sp. OK202]SFE80427.1 Tautomerase enzyme [Variovorax sp. OK212]
MPIVTVTAQGQKTPQFKDSIFNAIQKSMAEIGVPEANKFHRFIELSKEDFRFGAEFPDARRPRGDDFVLVEIVWSTGRHVLQKKKMLEKLAGLLESAGMDPEKMMVYFQETAWENWACAGGRLTYA